MSAEFVHLHVHSQYSFLTGAVKLGGLPARVKQHGMRAVALTDHANMYGALRHYKACKAAGVQPILGCELNVARPGGALSHLVVLATNEVGYQNLVALVSKGHVAPASDVGPSVAFETIAERSRGLVR
jgi:DNA polymerase-3 subunit alpha